ncbi:MAG: ATP-binding protein, partial [Nanoarchaeota archaeon]
MKSEKNISTKNIKVPEGIVDQVLGQDEAVKIIKKAAQQRRHVLLIGEPGTGKSMLGMALAELLPKSDLKDILAYPNLNDENNPYIKTLNAGKGREEAQKYLLDANQSMKNNTFYLLIFLGIGTILSWLTWKQFSKYGTVEASIMTAAAGVVFGLMILLTFLSLNMGPRMFQTPKNIAPKVIVDNHSKKIAPFFDATGAHAGALLGDVLHDPFQSGGLGTPANQRVVAGMIHKAHKGVLFIDEIATLHPRTQQELLSALQEKKFPITGQSERSAGAMVRTESVPCDFILVAAGNMETIKNMHPALRSRIRGYGYEVYMNETMLDTKENRAKIAR